MCGITGLWHTDGQPIDEARLRCATDLIRHRGPDDEGYVRLTARPGAPVEEADLAFGFRRLAILDLSAAGHQPMSAADGRLWIVFNGEIYNYRELRVELQARGYAFRSQTDTEVILHAYAEWGEACVDRFNGMWALALWDQARRRLFCARDRFGIKPFFYTWDGRTFAFASEIKALWPLWGGPRRANAGAVFDYLAYGLIEHHAETFFDGVRQLPPAHTLTVREGQLTLRRYWELDPARHERLPTDQAYAQAFTQLFEDAVRLHLRSDVAIGTCLSGGLDSSSIVCVANRLLFGEQVLATELVGAQQKTFSSCFEDPRFDEREHIQRVLEATNAEANFIFPTPEKLLTDLERLIWHQDEPFGSTSIFAQWCVMERVADRGVKVLLDGQGADELLAGYHPYFHNFWAALATQGRWGVLQAELAAYRRLFGVSPAYQLSRLARPLIPAGLMLSLRRLRQRGPQVGTLGMSPELRMQMRGRLYQPARPTTDPFYNDLYDAVTRSSLPGLLRYEDRNSMAHSVEARVPFLDYRLVEFVFALPPEQKIRHGLTKYVLRQAMRGVLPEAIRGRTDKMGFVTPERIWLGEPLRGWAREIVASPSFRQRGFFDAPVIMRALDEHAAGARDLSFVAWRWLNVELWARQFLDHGAA